jgi:radical SAM-linked protein
VAFGAALPVGEETLDDYLDVLLEAPLPAEEVAAALSPELPEGFAILGAVALPLRAPALMAQVGGALLGLRLPLEAEVLSARAEALLASPRLQVHRHGKGRARELELRASLGRLETQAAPPDGERRSLVLALLVEGEGGLRLKPAELAALLGCEPARCRITRIATLARTALGLVPMRAHLDILDLPGLDAHRGASRLDSGALAALGELSACVVVQTPVFSRALRE